MSGEIIVLPPSPLTMIMVTPASFRVPSNTSFEYMAMGMYADNTMEDLTADVTWASSDNSVATVSNSPEASGLMTGVAPGNATISASFDGLNGSTTIALTAPPAPPITVTAIRRAQNKSHLVTGITVAFSGPLDASEANDVATYRLTRQGKRGSFDGKGARVITLTSAVYDATLGEVTLTPRKAFSLARPVRLAINGMAPLNLEKGNARPMDGGHDGKPGSDAVAALARN